MTNTKLSPSVGRNPRTSSIGVGSDQRASGTLGRATATPAWASSRAFSSTALVGYRLASLDGSEFQSNRLVHTGGQTGFAPIMAASMSAVHARWPSTHAAWFMWAAGWNAIWSSVISATSRLA